VSIEPRQIGILLGRLFVQVFIIIQSIVVQIIIF